MCSRAEKIEMYERTHANLVQQTREKLVKVEPKRDWDRCHSCKEHRFGIERAAGAIVSCARIQKGSDRATHVQISRMLATKAVEKRLY